MYLIKIKMESAKEQVRKIEEEYNEFLDEMKKEHIDFRALKDELWDLIQACNTLQLNLNGNAEGYKHDYQRHFEKISNRIINNEIQGEYMEV